MCACDVIAHASRQEPFGLVLVEAAMCGKPVVASDVSGPREIVTPGETGFLCPPGDFLAMSRFLQRLASDVELRRRMGSAGKRDALRRFDLQSNVAELDQAIHEMLLAGNRHGAA